MCITQLEDDLPGVRAACQDRQVSLGTRQVADYQIILQHIIPIIYQRNIILIYRELYSRYRYLPITCEGSMSRLQKMSRESENSTGKISHIPFKNRNKVIHGAVGSINFFIFCGSGSSSSSQSRSRCSCFFNTLPSFQS